MWGTGRPGRWSRLDVVLLEALTLYEAGLCGSCGQPLQFTTDPMNTLQMQANSVSCIGCESIAGFQKAHEPGPGEKVYVDNRMSEGR